MKPLISILIPCYNGLKFLKPCLDSCLQQTYPNVEIIIVNDGSTDDSLALLNDYATRYDNITVYTQANCGLSATRNRLIDYAQGEYFFFLDADDLLPETALDNLYKGSNSGFNDLIVGRTMCLVNNKFRFPFVPTWWKVKNMDAYHYVKSNICTPWGVLVRTRYFQSLNVKFIPDEIFEDVGVMPYVYIKAEAKFNFIKNVVYNYRIKNRDNNLSSFSRNYQHKIFSLYQQAEQILALLEKEGFNHQKKYRRYVNGINYQILLLIVFLSKNYRSPFQIGPRFNIMKILNTYGYQTIRFSKTFWKSLSFFMIKIWYAKVTKALRTTNGNFTTFLNYDIIDNRYQYQLVPWSEQPLKKNQIYLLNEADVAAFKATFRLNYGEKKPAQTLVLLNLATTTGLEHFLKEHYDFFAQEHITLGLKITQLPAWNLILKHFAFVYTDELEVLDKIRTQKLKVIVISKQVDNLKLVNYVVSNAYENI